MKNNIILCAIIFLSVSCNPDFLDVKSDESLTVPTTLKDMEALMDNNGTMNSNSVLLLGEIGTDNISITEGEWNLLSTPFQKNGYIWAEDIYENQQCVGWNNSYLKILYANLVLEGISKIQKNNLNSSQWDRVKGTALFFRGWQLFQLAQVFCDDYDKEGAASKLGLPLKLTSNINDAIYRESLEVTYSQIVNDLNESVKLLPDFPAEKTRPSKQAVYALLARMYLQMDNYSKAEEAASLCLNLSNKLINYNDVDISGQFAFPFYADGNVEQPFFDQMIQTQLFVSFLQVDENLMKSYSEFDLRPSVFFSIRNGYYSLKGSYNGFNTINPFPAIDEVYLIRAECLQRLGDSQRALDDINYLLSNRIKSSNFVPLKADGSDSLLDVILLERNKELVFRGVRWSDLKRLNKEAQFEKVIKRKLGNKTFELLPNDKRYTWPIPDNVIKMSKIEQNIR